MPNQPVPHRNSRSLSAALGDLPPEIRHVWLVIIVLSLLSTAFLVIEYFRYRAPVFFDRLMPLLPNRSRFRDFTIYVPKFQLFHTKAFFDTFYPFTYPAPVALVYKFFIATFGAYALHAFVAFSILAFILPTILFGRALRRRGLSRFTSIAFPATLLLCSWPAIVIVDRGNMEVLVWIALVIAAWAFATGRGYLAAVFFGLAASLKLFPFIYLTLFLSTRRWKQLLVGVLSFVVISLVALAVLGPTVPIAAKGISDGLHFFETTYMMQWHSDENGIDHSIFAAIKLVLIIVFDHPHDTFERSLSIYTWVTAAAGIILYFWRIRVLPIISQFLTLSIISIYFTSFSGDGTLVHLYYPFGMLIFLSIEAYREGIVVKGLNTALCLLGFLVTYVSLFTVGIHRFEGEVKCLALGLLLIVALVRPFGPPLSLERSDVPRGSTA